MTKYDIYGIGAALVDTEVEVSDAFLANANIDKGVMTLVDEARQAELLGALSAESGSCLLYTSPSPRDQRGSRMPSSA